LPFGHSYEQYGPAAFFPVVTSTLPNATLGPHHHADIHPSLSPYNSGAGPAVFFPVVSSTLSDPTLEPHHQADIHTSLSPYHSGAYLHEGPINYNQGRPDYGMCVVEGMSDPMEISQTVIPEVTRKYGSTAIYKPQVSKPAVVTETTVEKIKCTWPECRSNKSFGRKTELDRHMKKHTGSVKLPCPVLYCSHRERRPFYRDDKFTDHLRQAHTEDEMCECSVDGCTAPPMPLILLRLHTHNHHRDTSSGLTNPLSYGKPNCKCELKKCKKWFGDDLQDHLLRHPLEHRRSQSDVVRKMGYDPITAEIICPLCEDHFADRAQFISHLELTHLTNEPAHWLSFKQHIPARMTVNKYIWEEWYQLDEPVRFCPHCGESTTSYGISFVNHHLTLLTITDELKAASLSILRLVADFHSHPIFKGGLC
jgi:hypothetical protein